LSVHEVRLVTNDYTFQHNGWRHQIEAGDIEPRMRRAKITLEISLGGTPLLGLGSPSCPSSGGPRWGTNTLQETFLLWWK
jgi:hypothetical protein